MRRKCRVDFHKVLGAKLRNFLAKFSGALPPNPEKFLLKKILKKIDFELNT